MPAKKFFDIYPSKKTQKEEIRILPERPQINFWAARLKNFSIRNRFVLLLGFFLIFLVFFLQFSNKSEIDIWPKKETLSFKETLVVDAKSQKPDFSKKTISGKIFSKEGEISQEFEATGLSEKQTKASGTIRVFNNYHLPQVLVATTRFISADGKLFRSLEDVNIPAGQSLDVLVEAAETGPDYNIKPTSFSIPGLLGSARYTLVYGKSFSAMQGGAIEKVAQVTKDDLEKAEKSLRDSLFRQITEDLKEQAGSFFLLVEEAVNQETLEKSFSKETGQEAGKFNGFLKLKAEGLAFSESELKDLVKKLISERIGEKKSFKEDTLNIEFFPGKIDLKSGKISLGLEITGEIYSNVDLRSLKETLAGASLEESEISLKSHSEIEKAKVRVWPFWVRNIPQDSEKIKVNLKLVD